ncbi:MAG: DUF2202 domain-containing protein [Maribacter sp.]|uniref:DUF2202 domain-containing protein n=1 Tax=Maribacter sp. TaxID=1897614 RepID=UPI003C742ABC
MKFKSKTQFKSIGLALLALVALAACDNDETEITGTELNVTDLTLQDENALLFMLEEEKLARDTYDFLDGLYGINQFANIKVSEQSHVDAVAKLLDQYQIEYTLLPYGEFANEEMQKLYDQFMEKGQIDASNALEVGATIEDLDIVDLVAFIDAATNPSVIGVFESLQCGSRNHLRSFVRAIENSGETYAPQFLTIEEYNTIVDSTNERCGP